MDEWTEPHIAAKGCAFQIFPRIGCRKRGVTAEKPSASPALRRDGTCYVCAQCSLRCLTDSPTQPSMVSQNQCWAQRSDCAFNQRQTKKGEIPHRKCHQAVISTLQLCWLGKEIQGNRRPLYTLELERRTPQLNFQIKSVFFSELSDQDFSREGILSGTLRPTILWALKVWPQHGKLLYFRNPRNIVADYKDEKQFCAEKSTKVINLCFLCFWIPNLSSTGKGNWSDFTYTVAKRRHHYRHVCQGQDHEAAEKKTWGRNKSPSNYSHSLLSHHQAYNSTSTFIHPFYRWEN